MHALGALADRMAVLESLFDLDGSVAPRSQLCLTRGLRGIRTEVGTHVKEFTAWRSQLRPLRASSKREEMPPKT